MKPPSLWMSLKPPSDRSTEQAQAASMAAQQALQIAESGTKAVGANLEDMFTLEEKVGIIAEQMVHLSEQANQNWQYLPVRF